MIKFLPLDFLGVSYRIPSKDKNAVYRLQISALVLEIFKFEKTSKICKSLLDHAYEAPFANMKMERQRWPETPFIMGRSGTQYVAMVTELFKFKL